MSFRKTREFFKLLRKWKINYFKKKLSKNDKKYNISSKVTLLFKDAQIQYRPLSAKAKSSNEDVPMPMIDIQLPFNNHTHIVTWLDPKTMKPKSKPERSAMQKEDAESKPKKAKRRGRPRIYNIRPAPLFPVVMLKIYETDHPNVTLMVNDKSSSR